MKQGKIYNKIILGVVLAAVVLVQLGKGMLG